MIIDHICFAVKDLDAAIVQWTGTFEYEQLTEIVTNTHQLVKPGGLSRLIRSGSPAAYMRPLCIPKIASYSLTNVCLLSPSFVCRRIRYTPFFSPLTSTSPLEVFPCIILRPVKSIIW